RPESFSLSQNFPNPFNPTTVIRFNLPKMEEVSLKVYDILGRQVALLLDERLAAGDHTITFDGRLLPSGVYLYVLRSQNRLETRRMVLLK
ncbi:MAG TPA: T9SS type A sorting domain-containing protein, partial [Candidatus Kryptobacter bacterium]|nr:T9SS type A sorting domain-containing protein [Candidatus Kryptobacter bacterium]